MLYFTCFLAAACGYLVGGINPSIILFLYININVIKQIILLKSDNNILVKSDIFWVSILKIKTGMYRNNDPKKNNVNATKNLIYLIIFFSINVLNKFND